MDFSNSPDSIHRDDFFTGMLQRTSADVMKNQQQQQQQSTKPVADMASTSSPSANFSYPRPESRFIRHEPKDSRSSMTSNGSVPGMTDASDSEASADDDFHYNASASELWDSFWPNDASRLQSLQPLQGSTSPSIDIPDFFAANTPFLKSERVDDGTITIPSAECQPPQVKKPLQWPVPNPRHSRLRPTYTRGPATTSILPTHALEQTSLPARTTSLAPEVPQQQPAIKRKPLRSSKSIANLNYSKSRAHLHPLYEAPTASTSNSTIKQDVQSVPVSPVYPEAPKLRPSSSAYDIRQQHDADALNLNRTHHNATAPLAPLPRPFHLDQPTRPTRPQLERYVSVFECDSDSESEEENSRFVRRLTRGLQHKKSTVGGEKRGNGDRKTQTAATLSPPTQPGRASRDPSENRRRGGSLGRILGLKVRSSS